MPAKVPSNSTQPKEQTTKRRDRKTQRTRRELALAAVKLFSEKGFSATNVEEITETADYSASTFFRQFADKEEVVFFDFAERLEELKAAFKSAHEGVWKTTLLALIGFARGWDADGEFGRQRALLFHTEPALRFRYLAKNSEWEGVIAELAATELASDPDVELVSHLIACTAVGAFRSAWYSQFADEHTTLEECVRTAFSKLEDIGRFFPSHSIPG